MKVTAWVAMDPNNPGRYLIALGAGGFADAEVCTWRMGREALAGDPDAYAHCCRVSFEHWVSQHPEVTG